MASPQGNSNRPRKVVALIVVLAIVAAAVGAVAFALVPYGSRSQVLWDEFRKEQGLTAVCLGSSIGAQSYDPAVVDEALGSNSFNMCSPHQTVAESYLGLDEALEHHDLDRVYYVVDFASLWEQYDMYPGKVFLNEKWKGDGFFQRFSDLAYALKDNRWAFDEKSINWLFPWTEQRVGFSSVGENITMRLDGTTLIAAAERNARFESYPWVYYGKGYGNYDGVCDYNASDQMLYTDLGIGPLQRENLQCLADICDRCARGGVELVAFVPPRPDFGLVDMQGCYEEHSRQVRAVVEGHGGSYYDFNLAKPELFESQERYFWDWEHCNAEGARAFSASLAQLLQRRDDGEDVDALFMTYDEKLASIDGISIVTLSDEPCDGGVLLTACALDGTDVVPEYEFLVGDTAGSLQVVQGYSENATCLFAPPYDGSYVVRVNARKLGSTADFERYCQREVLAARAEPSQAEPAGAEAGE